MLLLGAAALAWSPPAPAVSVCKWASVEADPFTGATKVVLETNTYTITHDEHGAVFQFPVGTAGTTTQTLPAGFPVLFLLDDGTKVTLHAERPAVPQNAAFVGEASTSIVSTWLLDLPVSPEAAHAFARSRIRNVRYTLDKEITLSLERSKWTRWLQRDMACLANIMGGEPVE